jgi:fructose-specific phosphotransferase system IIC component
MDAVGSLLQNLGNAVAGLIEGMFRAFGAAVQAVFGAFQSILPGLWLPLVAFVVAIVVFWQLIKR